MRNRSNLPKLEAIPEGPSEGKQCGHEAQNILRDSIKPVDFMMGFSFLTLRSKKKPN